MNKVAKIVLSVAMKIRQGDSKSCSQELELALKQELGQYFVEAKPAQTNGLLNDIYANKDVCVCHLIFIGEDTGAIFERESIVDILEKMKLESFDVVAVSHTPFYYTEYKK